MIKDPSESVELKYKYNSESDSKDVERTEEPWSNRNEKYISDIRDRCYNNIQNHRRKAGMYRRRYVSLSIPNILIPLTLSSFSQYLYPIVKLSGNVLNTMSSGLLSFFNYGKLYTRHLEAANKYESLMMDIDAILSKKKQYREDADITIERIKNTYNLISQAAPD